MTDDFRDFIVTDDASLLTKLWARFTELGTFGVAEYAHSMGLYPPGYKQGQKHSITAVTPADHEAKPYLVWSIGLDRPGADDQEPEVWEDGEDPWAGMVDIVDTPSDNKDNSE